jgi:predicted nucleic acid-binding protein
LGSSWMKLERRYWDSGCFLAILNREPGRVDTCAAILKAAERRDLEIVTSAFTITEVLYPKNGEKLAPEKRHTVRQFFRRRGIVLVNCDREVAEAAQDYVWDFNVRPKDAIHVASAIRWNVPVIETYDGGLLKLSEKVAGDPILIIRKPEIAPVAIKPQVDLLDL